MFLCEDFNTVVNPRLDRFSCNPESPLAYNWSSTLSTLMAAFELCDAWHTKHPGYTEFTWRQPNGAQGSRIDMIWLPKKYFGFVLSMGSPPFCARITPTCIWRSIFHQQSSEAKACGSLTHLTCQTRPSVLKTHDFGWIGVLRLTVSILSHPGGMQERST